MAATVVSWAAGVAACGSSGNPPISSPDFVPTCITKVEANQRAAASVNVTDYCRCYQQRLESIGLGAQTLSQASDDPQAAAAIAICGANLLGRSAPSTTT